MNAVADKKPIRVCFIAPKAYPLFNPRIKAVFGGAEVDLYFLATELAKDENFEVSFITADYGQEKIQTIEGVKLIKSLDFNKNALLGAIKIWQALREAKADIYFIKTFSPGTPLVAFFCWLHRRVFVYRTAHQDECDGTYLKQHPLLGRAFKWALRKAKLVFTQNKTDRENLKRTLAVDSIVIPNGHRLVQMKEHQRNIILWVGRSARFKKPELFIDLAQKIPGEQFTMICQRAIDDDKYEELAARAKAVKNLEFTERVSFDQIDGYFQQAKVFINTSDAEGFANTFIQACLHGSPILSLNVNPDGFLDKYNCGICCHGSLEQLTDALSYMLAENRFMEMGKKAREYAEQNHDIKKIVQQYKNLFRKLL